jgi:broad specificity phosphatase PhoE
MDTQTSFVPERIQTVETIKSPLRNRYFGIRHGQSEANVKEIISSDIRTASAYPLTELGQSQAQGEFPRY